MMDGLRPFAVVTGASTGIGFELAKQCAENGFDVLIAADEPAVHEAAEILKRQGGAVQAVEADLATREGVDELYEAACAQGRAIDALLANAGRGLGQDDPADVVKEGFEAMMQADGGVIYGMKNKAQVAVSRVMSSERLAEQHRQMAAPGTAERVKAGEGRK